MSLAAASIASMLTIASACRAGQQRAQVGEPHSTAVVSNFAEGHVPGFR